MRTYSNVRLIWDSDHGPDCEGWYVRYDEPQQSNLDAALTACDLGDPAAAEAEARRFLAGYEGPIEIIA